MWRAAGAACGALYRSKPLHVECYLGCLDFRPDEKESLFALRGSAKTRRSVVGAINRMEAR